MASLEGKFFLRERKSILRGLIFRIHKIRGILDNEKGQTLLMNFSKGNSKYIPKYPGGGVY